METLVLREERPPFNYPNDFGGFWKPGLWLLQSLPPFFAFTAAALGCLGAAVSERAITELDDNIVIPLVASGLATASLNYYAVIR